MVGMDTMKPETIEPMTPEDDQRWRAVLDRDTRVDGAFVYAVRSTGIFCRPSCPSRKAARDQVRFFDAPAAAMRAGYRACKRCRPDEPDQRLAAVARACAQIETSDEDIPSLADLSAGTGLSPYHLQRQFKAVMGVSPKQYAEAIKLGRLKAALRDGEPVASALYGAGYGSPSRLYEKAPARLGMTPASYAKGGDGARIVYAILARGGDEVLLVAATERGLCMVELGDDESRLVGELHAEYPTAEIRRDDDALGEWAQAVAALAAGDAPRRDLPLDVRATAFQWLVWERLKRIPRGATRSYREIAAELGKPEAARAVARACATNPVALVIPCHRVVGGDGRMRGYRWGVERKRSLLERERSGDG